MKFLQVLRPLSKDICLIAVDCPPNFRDQVWWIKTKHFIKKRKTILSKGINLLLMEFKLIFFLVFVSKRYCHDIVIFLSNLPISMFFAKLMGKKVVLYEGGSFSRHFSVFYKLLFEKIPYILSNRIIIEAESSMEFQNLTIFKEKVVIGSLYVEKELFRYNKKFDERSNIGYFGRLTESKGIQELLNAIIILNKKLQKEWVKVIIGGGGPLFERIKQKIRENELDGKVKLVGWVPHQELSEYLNNLKLLILPSRSEGLPNIILEAIACGTVVLATPVGGIPDVIKDGETGFIMENNSPECIAKNVIRALNHPNLGEIVKNAQKLINDEYTYEAAVERYRRILEKI